MVEINIDFTKIRSYSLHVIEYSSLIEEFSKIEIFLNAIKQDYLSFRKEKKTSVPAFINNKCLYIESYSIEIRKEIERMIELLNYYKGCYIDFEK